MSRQVDVRELSRQPLAQAAAVGAVLVLLWWALVWSSQSRSIDAAKDRQATADQLLQVSQARLAEVERLEAEGATTEAELARLEVALPRGDAGLGGFQIANAELAGAAGVAVASVEPQPSAAPDELGVVGTPVVVRLGGTNPQVLDYLERLEALPRLVVVDAVQLTATGQPDRVTGELRLRVFHRVAPGTAAPAE